MYYYTAVGETSTNMNELRAVYDFVERSMNEDDRIYKTT